MTRLLPRHLSIASAICAVLALATAPQVRACKNSTADKNPSPCSSPGPSESDASLMFAASTPTTSIPDLNSDAPARTPPVQFGPELRPAARRATPMSASKTGAKTASATSARQGKEAAAKADAHPAASTEAKKAPESAKWTASAPRASESASRTIVSRPHRMPSPEIF